MIDREALAKKCKKRYGLKPQKRGATCLVFQKKINGKSIYSRCFNTFEDSRVEFNRLMGKLED